MIVVQVEVPAERSRMCERVLRDLREWFGIESEHNPCLVMVSRL
jgi:hypothetical protein